MQKAPWEASKQRMLAIIPMNSSMDISVHLSHLIYSLCYPNIKLTGRK